MHAARKAAILLVSILLLAGSASIAQAGRLVAERFASPTLGRDWDYLAYLPDGYELGKLQYPVLYLLHGYAQDHYEWVTKGKIQRLADRMILAGEIPPCIIIMPSAGSSWYVDRQEPLETAFIADLMPETDRRYRTIQDRFGRVIGGVSMGGYGALRFVLKFPELFAAAALLSPSIYIPEPPANSSARWAPPFQTEGRFDPEVWRSLNYPTLLESFAARNIIVPLHLASGDHDEFQAEYHAAVLYKIWRDHGWPAEFRVVAGEHNFGAWRDTAAEALRFIFETVRRPETFGRNDAHDVGP